MERTEEGNSTGNKAGNKAGNITMNKVWNKDGNRIKNIFRKQISARSFSAIIALVLVCGIILSLCGCGANAASQAKQKMAGDYVTAETSAAMAYDTAMAYDEASGYSGGDIIYNDGDYAYEAEGGMAAGNGTGAAGNLITDTSRKLVKNVYISIETKKVSDVTTALEAKVKELGGYIENTTISTPDSEDSYYPGQVSAYYTVRIPSDKLDTLVESVEGTGNVTYKSESVEDITLQYTDIESHKKALKTEQTRLEELMEQAETVEDLIAIEERLSEVRYELESIESQLRVYDNQVEYSTVNIDIIQVVEYTPARTASFGERIAEGLKETWANLGIWLEDAAVWIIVSLPIIIIVAAVAAVVVIIIKTVKKRKERGKENGKDKCDEAAGSGEDRA